MTKLFYAAVCVMIAAGAVNGQNVLINFQDNLHGRLLKTTSGADHFYTDNTYQNWKAIKVNDSTFILRQPIFKMSYRSPLQPRADVTGIWHDTGDTLPKHCNNIIIVKYE